MGRPLIAEDEDFREKFKMKSQKNETQIAIIGATQSGKTTLAAGLAKTSSPEFTVGFANPATSDYFQPRIAGIAAGHWPEPTNEKDKDIGLSLNTLGGRSALISFKEYKGERFDHENYLEQIVGKPNGALILLSPGMESLRDPVKREELIGNLKGIIDHLKDNKCAAIAFVVTACDRLKTDLKDFAEEFGNYAAEVSNYLNTSGLDWKRFDVTITGELADQQKPSIAVGDKNTARDPFVWIMDRVAGRKHMAVAKRIGVVLGVLVLAGFASFAAICGGRYYLECSGLTTREKTVAEIENKIESATRDESESGLKSATDELAEQIKANKARQYRFLCCETRRTNDIAKWSKVYDEARTSYFSVSIDKRMESCATRGDEKQCADFDKLLAEFAPVDSAGKTALTNRWTKLRPKIREGYDVECGNKFRGRLAEFKPKEKNEKLLKSLREFKDEVSKWETEFVPSQNIRTNVLHGADELIQHIEEELDSRAGNDLQNQIDDMTKNAATKATVDALEKLRQNVAGWEPYAEEGKTRKSGISKNLEDNKPLWEHAYLDNCCTTNAEAIVRKIRDLNPNDSDDICDTLKTAYGFTNEWTKASTNVVSVATNKICEASSRVLSDFLCSFTNKWNIYGEKKPEIYNDDKNFIEAALDLQNPNKPSEKLSVWFLKELEEARSDAEKSWREQQKKTVDDYIAIVKNMSAVDMFDSSTKDSYRNWYEKNCDNPFVTNVDSMVEKKVSAFFEQYIDEMRTSFLQDGSAFNSEDGRRIATRRFAEFQRLCLALEKDGCGLKDSWCAKFARECVNGGKIREGMNRAFEQVLTVTRIDVKVMEDGISNDYIGGKFSMSCRSYMIAGHELKQVAIESFFLIDDFEDYEVKSRNSWQTLWNGTKRLSLNPWTCSEFAIEASLDLSLTPADAKGGDFCRIFPLRSDYTSGLKEWRFNCNYITLRGREQSYTCHVRIYCTFEGADIFDLFNQYRK